MTSAAGDQRPVLERFVIRVYRRGPERGCELSGLLERVPGGVAEPFKGRDDLWERMVAGGRSGVPPAPAGTDP